MLKPGYKQTELGVLPEEWDIYPLGKITHIKTGKKNNEDKIEGGRYPFFVRSQQVEAIDSYSFDGEAILLPGEGNIGSIFHYINGKFDYHQRVYKVSHFASGVVGRYIYYYMAQNFGAHAAINTVKAAVDSLRLPTFQEFLIPLPPPAEQKAIADALGAIDALLTNQRELLAKKRALKQAAQQALLSGEKRLPGFAGEWEEKSISTFAQIQTGNTPPTNNRLNYGNEFLFVSPGDLGTGKYVLNTFKKLSSKGFSISRRFPPGSILVTCIGSTIGKSGIAPIELTSNQQINAVIPNESFSSEFLYYTLSQIAPEIRASASEQAVPMVNKTAFGAINVRLPDIAEQRAIATVLSDMDAALEALAAEIEKTQALKQGMMQDLLTGTIRLVSTEAATPIS